jgi:Tetratricopeptide repeat
VITRYRLARVIGGQGRHGEAEEMLRRVLADRERVLGTEHPDTEQARNQLTRITGPPRNTS